jgi:hypothetical protein
MDQTSRGYPFPECEPPLVKDASFIGQMEDLAQAINDDVQSVVNFAGEVLIAPDVYRGANVATNTTSQQVDVVGYAATFVNNPDMDEFGGCRVQKTGWYLLASFTTGTIASTIEIKQLYLRNGQPLNQFGDAAQIYIPTQQACSQTDVALLNAGDLISVRVRHETGGSPAWTYQNRLTVFLLDEL